MVYNWGEYIADGSDGSMDVIAEFEERTGIDVEYVQFESNEEMYTKIKSGSASYDIIIPSDYMISRMIEEDMLQEINFDNIPNYKYIMDAYKGENVGFDPSGKYSVPYTWGTVGIIYNKTMVEEPVDSWDILWDETYSGKILMFRNERDAFGLALKKLGYSLNSTSEAELREAADLLREQNSLIDAYVMDEVFGKMESGEDALATYYSGDAVNMMETNPDLGFAIPKEGTNIFVDAIVIPKNAKNVPAAEKFIDFLCDPEIALENIEYICYSSPNSGAYEMLDDEVKNNPVIYPDEEIISNCEAFVHLPPETIQLMSDLWTEIRAGQ